MHPLVYVMLVAGCAHASTTYRKIWNSAEATLAAKLNSYENMPREYIERGIVECPVCTGRYGEEEMRECTIVRSGKTYKKCKHGIYINEMCGYRLDCFRGPGERCTDFHSPPHDGRYCMQGYSCDTTFNECTGSNHTRELNDYLIASPNMYLRLDSKK